jgi:monooxygenase
MSTEHFDVVVVGAGLSGIGAGCHFKMHSPTKKYVILEGRSDSGGTWDLFRYPGIRSDSDMYTLGYGFRPWTEAKAIADGPSILKYVRETAQEYGVDKNIRFEHKVVRANWCSRAARWTVDVEVGAARAPYQFTCGFLFMCSGYYDYAGGYTPDFPGVADYGGRLVHPQLWTDDIDYSNKQVVVIGSGATAVTLVPELAKKAAHVTMLQRSPSYMVSGPSEDALANATRKYLPEKLAYALTRLRKTVAQQYLYAMCMVAPNVAKKSLIGKLQAELGPDADYAKDWTPRYNPWTQRLCLVPDNDLFNAIKSGRADVITDHIESFTRQGLRLKSGKELAADIVVTATGLKLLGLGGASVSVDGSPISLSQKVTYKGMMYNEVPNLATTFGYTNASWTLRSDLTARYVCRLLQHMDASGTKICTPRLRDLQMKTVPWVNFSSGYFQRAADILPKQGDKKPWLQSQNYALDLMLLKYGAVDDGVMEFTGPSAHVFERALAAE